ncbi:cytochrome B5 isoform E [Perilla frutescens var. hirtella]|nr:cytochrome B5 isoform E [Perilla frutescens var. frutescens]KAH6784108.1 cytochrome B5 isoform E [Perilla frutescens var. hirtella]
MASNSRVHVFEEVLKHNKLEDCWIIVNGKVYDVTPFMAEHPGGDEVILSSTGKDATSDYEEVGHSDSAREMMDKYYIGDINMDKVPARRSRTTSPFPFPSPLENTKTPEFLIKALPFLVPLFILGSAFAVRHYTKEN